MLFRSLIGLLQLITGRYLKHKHSWRQTLHSVMGILLFLFILSAFMVVWRLNDWTFSFDELHFYLGYFSMVIGITVCLGGLTAGSLRYVNMDWKTSLLLLLSKVHGLFGYGVVLFS